MAWVFVLECVEDMGLRLLELLLFIHIPDNFLRLADHVLVQHLALRRQFIHHYIDIGP